MRVDIEMPDPAIAEVRAVIGDTIGMLGIVLNDHARDLPCRARTIALQLQAVKLRRADAVLRDFVARQSK